MAGEMFDGVDESQHVSDSELAEVQPEEGQPPETEVEEGITGQADEGKIEGAGKPSPTGDFEFEGVSFKGLTPEQRKAIELGAMRTADYTRGKQGVKATVEERLNNIHASMMRDPRLFLQYFPPHYLEHVLGLVKGAGQPKGGGAKIDLSKFEPEVATVIGGLQEQNERMMTEIGRLNSVIGQHDTRFSSFDERQASADLTKEVNEALDKHKDLNTEYDRKLILTMIANDGEMTALDAAAQVSKLKKAHWSQKVNQNSKQNTKVVGAGRSTPPAPGVPKTLDEAEARSRQRFGALGG